MVEQIAAETKVKGPRTAVRKTFLVLTMVIIAGIATQVTLIGLGLFYDPGLIEAHVAFGWGFGHLGAAMLIVGFFGRLGRNLTTVNAINFVLFAALPFLAGARESSTFVAGIHPLVAFTVFGLTLVTALKLRSLIASGASGTTREPATARLVAPPKGNVVQGRMLSDTQR